MSCGVVKPMQPAPTQLLWAGVPCGAEAAGWWLKVLDLSRLLSPRTPSTSVGTVGALVLAKKVWVPTVKSAKWTPNVCSTCAAVPDSSKYSLSGEEYTGWRPSRPAQAVVAALVDGRSPH